MDDPSEGSGTAAGPLPDDKNGGGDSTRASRGDRWKRLASNGGSARANGAPAAGPGPSDDDQDVRVAVEAPPEDDQLLAEDQPLLDDEPEYEDERARAFLAGGAYATVAIDRYDDLPAIFGKIDAAASPRVALVAARGNRELQRALSMRRLQRHLDLHGKDLILVSRSRALRLRAREEELPAVGSLRRVNFQTYGRGGLQLGWLTLRLPSIGALTGLMLLVAALLAGAAVLFWYLPRAEVTIFLPVTAQQDTLELTLDGQTTTVDLENGIVPARRRDVTTTRSIYRPATGVVQVPTNHAAVGLRFTNRTNAALVVPKGTVVVAANNVKFTVGNDVNLPRLNATADVVALAQQPGTIGNIPPNSATRIEGDLAQRVAVTNPAAGEKGTDTPQQVVSEADVEGVRAFAEPILVDGATQDLLQRFAETATVFMPGASAQISELKATPPVNVPAPYTEVKVTGRVSLLTAEDADLNQVYVNHFRSRISPEEMLLDGEFTTTVVGNGALERAVDRLPITVQVEAFTAPFLDRATVQQALAGKSKKGVEQVVRALVDGSVPPTVKISPGWAPRVPRRAERITVIFAPAPQ